MSKQQMIETWGDVDKIPDGSTVPACNFCKYTGKGVTKACSQACATSILGMNEFFVKESESEEC